MHKTISQYKPKIGSSTVVAVVLLLSCWCRITNSQIKVGLILPNKQGMQITLSMWEES
jgi:cytoskeletal protein RodZ